MITKFLLQLRILPRWVIILLDLFIVASSTFLGYLLRFNFEPQAFVAFKPELGVLINTLTCLLALIITKSYAGIVRYTGLKDGLRVLNTLIITHVLTTLINLTYYYNTGKNIIPYSVVLISFLASFVFLFQYRLLIKNIFSYYRKLYKPSNNVAIFGAGQMGMITKGVLDSDADTPYEVCAFFEDNSQKWGKEINGTVIYSFEKLKKVKKKFNIQELIIAIQNISFDRKNEIVDACLQLGIEIRTVPSLETWVKGELSINQIQNVKIEDLLERESIKLENPEVEKVLKNHKVLITGAAGSIGKELVMQVSRYRPSELILLDQSESGVHEVLNDLKVSRKELNYAYYIADITNHKRINAIFDKHKPDVVFHAAAYKHVPMMEDNVIEAVSCNIQGTYFLSNLASEYNVSKFVMVSTDKAVNPTNVMGCSKRIAELYVKSISESAGNTTQFITTRFGNVLGSNGSVIPYFKKQIEKGGPVTVTHPEITRYFMTISEACELVIEAGTMGKGGEIFLFDMGKSVKIVDLALKMIRLSGLKPYEDIDIVFTGLRQGEKLYEELLSTDENSLPTHHEKIMVAKEHIENYSSLSDRIEMLINQLQEEEIDEMLLVKSMKKIVPEFISNSSKFEILDKKGEKIS